MPNPYSHDDDDKLHPKYEACPRCNQATCSCVKSQYCLECERLAKERDALRAALDRQKAKEDEVIQCQMIELANDISVKSLREMASYLVELANLRGRAPR